MSEIDVVDFISIAMSDKWAFIDIAHQLRSRGLPCEDAWELSNFIRREFFEALGRDSERALETGLYITWMYPVRRALIVAVERAIKHYTSQEEEPVPDTEPAPRLYEAGLAARHTRETGEESAAAVLEYRKDLYEAGLVAPEASPQATHKTPIYINVESFERRAPAPVCLMPVSGRPWRWGAE